MNEQNANLSRRDFVKATAVAAAALVAAPLAIEAAAPTPAYALSNDNTGNITCNVYCKPDEYMITNVAGITKGYLTNPKSPSSIFDTDNRPTEPATMNANLTSTDENGNRTITVDLVNTVFRLVSITTAEDGKATSLDGSATIAISGTSDGYVTQLTVVAPASNGTFEFANATEYANIPLVGGTKNWNLFIQVGD